MATVEPETINGTADEIPDAAPQPTMALAVQPGSTELIHAGSAIEKVRIATEYATALDAVIKAQGMRTKVGNTKVVRADGKEEWVPKYHVNVEAWQTLATFLGLAVLPQKSTRVIDPETGKPERVRYTVTKHIYAKGTKRAAIQNGSADVVATETSEVDGYSWECHVDVSKNGVPIAGGDGMCSRTEETWRDRDDYALRGMAQTRATSRAIAGAARWIVTLAGYSATPAEEYGAHEAPQSEPAETDPEFGPPVPDTRRLAAYTALLELVGTDDDIGEAATQGLKDAAGELAKAITATAGYLPAIVVSALVMAARARADRRSTLSEPPDADVVEQATDTAGKSVAVTPPSLVRMLARLADRRSLAEVRGAFAFAKLTYPAKAQGDERFASLTEEECERLMKQLDPEGAAAEVRPGSVPMTDPRARELCTCRDGLDTPQADTDDRCPLADHGVPF